MEVYLRDLKQNEQVLLIKLHTIIRQSEGIPATLVPDASLFRFLRANNFDLTLAVNQIKECANWRRTKDWAAVQGLPQEVVQLMFGAARFGFYGEDAKGRPIRYIVPQKVDWDKMWLQVGANRVFDFQIAMLERMVNIVMELCTRKYNRYVYQMITIVDVKDLEVSKIISNTDMISFMRTKAPEFQLNFPELTFKAVIINAGPVFYTLWKIVSVFFKQSTIEKIRICNTDYLGELLEITTIDKIPKEYGGTSPYEIDNYPNFFDQEWYAAWQENRLSLR